MAQEIKGIGVDDILDANPDLVPTELREGMKIKIPRTKKITLESIAKEHNASLEKLKELNPAIKKVDQPLPDWYEKVRV